MAIQDTLVTGKKYRKCIDNTPGNLKWLTFSFITSAADVIFSDESTLQQKLGTFKGVTTNENQVAGYSTDITLFKSLKTSVTNSVVSLTNLINSVSNRLGGMRFYEDSTGKYIVGADSVPKKLGSSKVSEWTVIAEEWFGQESVGPFLNSGGYIVSQQGSNMIVGKDYDLKSIRADYQTLSIDNFTVNITQFLYHNANAGHKNDKYTTSGPTVSGYDPSTGILKVSCGRYSSTSPAGADVGSESVSLCLRIMLCT